MKEVLNLIRVLIAIDVGIVVFCYLENNFVWLYNTQIAFFATTLIVLGSFIGYSNMVRRSIENGNVGEDILKKYDDAYDLYDEEDEIKTKELENFKKKLKWYEALFVSFKGGLNLLRISGYALLIIGFIWLNKIKMFDYLSFLFNMSDMISTESVYVQWDFVRLAPIMW